MSAYMAMSFEEWRRQHDQNQLHLIGTEEHALLSMEIIKRNLTKKQASPNLSENVLDVEASKPDVLSHGKTLKP